MLTHNEYYLHTRDILCLSHFFPVLAFEDVHLDVTY